MDIGKPYHRQDTSRGCSLKHLMRNISHREQGQKYVSNMNEEELSKIQVGRVGITIE